MANDDVVVLTLPEILAIHQEVMGHFRGRVAFLDGNPLMSLVQKISSFVYGVPYYPTIWDKAAAYMFEIGTTHPFIDGNKRTAFLCGIAFLEKNGVVLDLSKDEGLDLMCKIVTKRIPQEEIAKFLEERKNLGTEITR